MGCKLTMREGTYSINSDEASIIVSGARAATWEVGTAAGVVWAVSDGTNVNRNGKATIAYAMKFLMRLPHFASLLMISVEVCPLRRGKFRDPKQATFSTICRGNLLT
jgi:hypothetical protein